MGLRCSLLGHDFAESEVENERERQGSEVVVTVRELDRCSRCGATRVVSENKEIRSVDSPDPGEPDRSDGAPVDGASVDVDDGSPGVATGDAFDAPVDDAGDDDAVILDAEEGPGDDPSTSTDPATTGAADATDAEAVTDADAPGATDEGGPDDADDAQPTETPADGADEEDVEFIDAESDAPADTADTADESEPASPAPDESETDPAPADDDGIIMDEASETDDRGHGEWPAVEDTEDVEEDHSTWPDVDADADAGFDAETAADPAATVEPDPEVEGTDAEFIDADRSTPDVEPSDTEWVETDREDTADLPAEGTGITSAGSAESIDEAVARGNVETELVCPECGHTARRNPSSLRSGDICPECARGYITERAVDR